MADDDKDKLPSITEKGAVGAWFVDGPDGKRKEMEVIVQGGDFSKLPAEVTKEADGLVPKIRQHLKDLKDKGIIPTDDPAKLREFAGAARIDGNESTLTDKELAAWLLAQSISGKAYISQYGPIEHLFDKAA